MDRIIDKAAWPRREIFDFFSGISNPFYAVTFRQDVTELRNYCKERKISFYYGLIYLCCKALQDVPAFACRIRGENVVELGEQKPSFTDLKKGSELFGGGLIVAVAALIGIHIFQKRREGSCAEDDDENDEI